MYSHHKTEKKKQPHYLLRHLMFTYNPCCFITYLKKRTETEVRQKGREKVGKQKNNSYQVNLLTALSWNLCLNR